MVSITLELVKASVLILLTTARSTFSAANRPVARQRVMAENLRCGTFMRGRRKTPETRVRLRVGVGSRAAKVIRNTVYVPKTVAIMTHIVSITPTLS